MFAEVYKKDSLQDEEYAECYVFDKTMLLSKTDLESYSTCDYDENIIRNFHQKQSSYAQSEGYHSYVSSNDSAIIAQFTDRSQLENDIIGSGDEHLCSSKDCGSVGDCRSSTDAAKLHNPHNSCNLKGASYERCNAQHIAHSARVQTPQRHYSESVQYLSTNPGPGSGIGPPVMATKAYYQQSSDQKHGSAVNSQLRKLYPVNTYCIQPNSCPSVATSFSKACDLNSNASKLTTCSKKTFFESDNMQCTKQPDHSSGRSSAEYTFLDPSKQRIVSNQNLKVIQKQALISYYERHHSTWRSEPQLSTSSSSMSVAQSRPRMPSPTSCHSLCSGQNEECSDADKNLSMSISTGYKIDNLASDHPANIAGHIPESGSYINNRWKSTTTTNSSQQYPISSKIGIPFDKERVPELPPKKNHLGLQTTARRLSSPDLPPPSPPPLLDDEIYVPDEPFPPPPIAACEEVAAYICDSSKTPDDAKSVPFGEIPSKSSTPTKIDSKLRTRTRTNSMYESSTSKYSKSRSISNDPDRGQERSGPQQPPGFVGRRVANAVKNIDDGKGHCMAAFPSRKTSNVARFSSSSFRTYKRSVSESMVSADEKFPSKMSTQANSSSAAVCDNAHRAKLPSQTKNDASSNATNHIEQKVKAIRTLFEDKLRKSNFQFPSFSFIHSEKFPSKLDPRFPRTSYQLSQTSNHREFRDCEKGEIFNAVGIYKRTTSPMRSVNDYDNVKSRVAINDPQPHQQQAQSPPYLKRTPITESLPSLINNPNEDQIPLDNIDQSPPYYRAILSMTTDISPPSTVSPSLSSPVTPIAEEDRILTAFRVSSATDFNDADNAPVAGHYLTQSSPQDICERGSIGDFGSIATSISPQLHCRSQSISPSEPFVKNLSLTTNPPNDAVLNSSDDVSCSEIRSNHEDDVEDIHRERNCSRVVAVPVFIGEDLSLDEDNSKNIAVTTDAASQTEVNIVSTANLQMAQPMAISLSCTSRNIIPSIFENEIENLRIEIMDDMMPSNRLYKVLEASKSNSKTATDYLENIFEPDVVLPGTTMQKNLSYVKQSQDTRLQEGSIAYPEYTFQLPQEMNTKLNISEDCDNFQNMTPGVNTMVGATTTTASTPVGISQEKKNTLVKHLIRMLDMLKSELDAISQESRKNEDLGMLIWQQIMQSLSAREASKYKLHFQEVGQITSLLLSLGARLAKVENLLQDLSKQDSQTEKKILEDRKSQLMQQLEDAKQLKSDIDKRSAFLTSLLQKYFNQQQLNQYHQFIQTKCQLLIYNRNLNDKIFTVEQQVNALKEDQIQPFCNTTYSCNK